MNQDLSVSVTEAQAAAAALISTEANKSWDQTDYQGEGNQGAQFSQTLRTEHDQESVPKIPVSQNENGCEDTLTDSKDLDNPEILSRSDGTEDENTTKQTKDHVSENLHKQNDAEETTELPELESGKDSGIGVYNEEQRSLNSSLYQVSASNTSQESIGKNFSDKSTELLRSQNPMPVSETDQTFDTNQRESDNKVENTITVAKQDTPQNYTVSPDCQAKWDNAKVPGILFSSSQMSNIKYTLEKNNLKPVTSLVSTPENSNKDCQEVNDSNTTKNQTQRLNNSKTNAFTPTPHPVANVKLGNFDSTGNNFKVIEIINDANFKGNKQCPGANPPPEPNTETLLTKPSFPPPLTQMTPDYSTHSQTNHLGQNPIPGQTLSEQNGMLQPNTQRRGTTRTPLRMGTHSYFDNSGQDLSQKKFGNEIIKPTNPVNLYSRNQTKMNTNQGRLNASDASSKFVPTNSKVPNPIRPRIQNIPQQSNQSTAQPIRVSTVPNNDKDNLESEPRFSFQTTTGINPGFSHNQRPCYTGYDLSSVPYYVYPDNGNIRQNGLCNRTSTMGNIANNNNPLSIQRPGIYSVQPFNQNMARIGSQYLLMWPPSGDQTGSNKLPMAQPFNTQGINSSYQQAPKNFLQNPPKGLNSYSTSASTNDAKRCKHQFPDGALNLLTRQQNPGERSNSTISHAVINKQQGTLQSIPGTYNTNDQAIPTQQNEMFMNRENDNTFPVNHNSMQRGQTYQHYQSPIGPNGNDLKVRLPNSSQSDLQFLAQSQGHLQRSSYDQYQELQHYYSGLSIPNANGCSVSNAMPLLKTQNLASSNLQTGYAQHLASSISNTSNPEIPNLQGQIMTTTATTMSTTSLSSIKELPKKESTRERSLPDTGQQSEQRGFQNKIPEVGAVHQDQASPKYPTQASMTNSSQIGTWYPASDANTIRPIYNKDVYANKGQTFYSPSSSESIPTWSQYYPHNFDPTRPLHPSQRGYANYDPPQGERNLTQFNFQLQNNIHSHFYASQSYNNYMSQVNPSFDSLQGTPRNQNPSNSYSTGNNYAATYNSSAAGQNPENIRVENQAGVVSEKIPVLREIPIRIADDQATWKPEDPGKKQGISAQTETNGPRSSGSDQFQNYNFASNLCPKAPERGTDVGKFTQILTPATASGPSNKAGDSMIKALSNPNLDLTSEESFLFSDFDPLFTSSLLTNELDFFPENNSAFDQCFEDAASITMATVNQNEARTQQSLNPVDPSQVTVPQEQQQQLTPLVNIQSNISAGSSTPNIPSSQIHYTQIQPTRTTTESTQIKNHYTSGAADYKNLIPLITKPNEYVLGSVPGINLPTLSPKIGPGDGARPSDLYPHDSIVKRFSDLCTSKTASQLAKTISDYKPAKKWVNKKGPNPESDETGTAVKRRNRQKKENASTGLLPGEEAVKKPPRKTAVPKGPPRPRGRPPKNKSLGITTSAFTQPVAPGISINDSNHTSQTAYLNIGPVAFGKDLPKPTTDFPVPFPANHPNLESGNMNMKNSSSPFPACGIPSAEPAFKDLLSKLPTGSNKSDDTISSNESSIVPEKPVENDACSTTKTQPIDRGVIDAVTMNESSLVSEKPVGNSCSTTKTQRELSDREVIDAVTKCLASISRNEETESSDEIKEYPSDAGSKKVDSSLDSSLQTGGTDSQSGGEGTSQEDQALSKEEKLMKAYTELKKKLEERMSRSLWRQSHLKRNEQKSNKSLRKLSKKECMTAYSGTSSWGPDDDLFSRYSNRSSANNDSKLVATPDSTSTNIDPKHDKPTEVIDIDLVRNLESVQKQISDTNDQLISSTQVSESKDETSKTDTILRLPSMLEVVRTRLTDDVPSLDNNHQKPLEPEPPKEPAESPVSIESVPNEPPESIEESQNIKEEIPTNETEEVKDPESGNSNSQQPKEQPPPPRNPVPQPYSPPPLLPPPLPAQVIHFLPNREKKVTPRKVGPTIVENAKICYEAIGKYLTKADSDFDSFLISYANIVQGLLNCGADRYGRIKATLLNKSNPESKELTTQEDKKTPENLVANSDDPSAEDPSEFHRDIDASDIQGDPGGGENTIDVDDFSTSYADIVKVILSSRADEYRNIKQALSRNICGGTDVSQGSMKSAGKGRNSHDAGSEISIPAPTGCDEASGAQVPKANLKNGKKTQSEILENPVKVIKKRRKRKIKEKVGAGVKSKVVFSDKTYTTGTSRKQAPKRKPKSGQYPLGKPPQRQKDRGRGSSSGSKKSPGFRIILSSSYFAEQGVKSSNFTVKSKSSGTSVGEDQEDAESRRPLSSDDGFVDESTGDYVMGLGSESGDEEKSSIIFQTEPLNMVDEQTSGNRDTTRSTKTVHNVQPKTVDNKPVSWYEDVFKTENNAPSTNLNLKKEIDCEDRFPDPKSLDEGFSVRDTESTVNMEKNEERKRQRPSRKAASAGVGAIRCPCGCSNDGSSLRDDSVESQLRDLTMSFKNRNRSKIIKPKSASIPKKRGRPRKIDKCPQKIISKLWTDISATAEEEEEEEEEEEIHGIAKVLSDYEGPSGPKMSEKPIDSFSMASMPTQIPATPNDAIRELSGRRVLYSDSDSEDLKDFNVLLRGTSDSDHSWKPKKSHKKLKRRTLKKKGRDLAKYHLFHRNAKPPRTGVHDSRPDGVDQKLAGERPTRMDESASDEDGSWTKKNSLNGNAASKSLTGTESSTEPSLKEGSRDGDISKTRISFKDFVPSLKLPPLSQTPSRNLETQKETNPTPESPKPTDPIESIEEIGKILTENDSNNKKEHLESSEPLKGEHNRITPNTEDRNAFLSDEDIICSDKMDTKVNNQRSQNDTSPQAEADDRGNLADVSKILLKETNSSEERLRSLIEKITEINAATKKLDTKRPVPVESGSENVEKDSNGKGLLPLDSDCGPKDSEGMRVKTELVERIDEPIRCPIGLNDTDDSRGSSSSDSGSSNQSGDGREKRRRSMSQIQTPGGTLEIKMPSPLKSKKKKANRTLKVQSVSFENKIIIRKTCLLEKKKRKGRIRQKLKRRDKNIFDIISQNESEDEESCVIGKEVKRENEGVSGSLSYSPTGKSEILSKTSSGVNKSDTIQKLSAAGKSTMSRTKKKAVKTGKINILDSHSDKPSLLLQTNGHPEGSPGFSENVNSSPEKSLVILKKRRKRVKANKSLLTEAKIPTESKDEVFNDSESYPRELHKNVQSDTGSTIDSSLGKKVSVADDSKTNTKKPSKKSKRDGDPFGSKDNGVCQKRKRRKRSLEPQNNLTLSVDRETGNKEKIIICGAVGRIRKTKMVGSSSDQSCGTPLKSESSLSTEYGISTKRKRSRRSVTDRTPLNCAYCPKIFKKPSELLYHTRSHTGDRPFPCDKCDKTFVSNAHLLRHQRTHSSERKHTCPTCGRGFTQHYGMLVHQLIHSGLKPHKCLDCPNAFRTKGSLGTHRRKHHPEQGDQVKSVELQKDPQDSK